MLVIVEWKSKLMRFVIAAFILGFLLLLWLGAPGVVYFGFAPPLVACSWVAEDMKRQRGQFVNWKCWSMLVVLFAACPIVYADEPASSPDATKRQQLRGAIFSYMQSAKRKIDKAWEGRSSPALITSLKLTLDAKGKIAACTVVRASPKQEGLNSVQECLSPMTFGSLPSGLHVLDLFWTFRSNGSRNSVEYTDSPEATAYYSNLLGGMLPPTGDWVVQNTAANHAVSMTESQGVNFVPWMDDLQRRIKRAWLPPKEHESDRVVLVFRVHRGGEVSDLKIQKSSGVGVSDQAALDAVQHAAPFRPLPAGPNNFIDLEFTFDFNVVWRSTWDVASIDRFVPILKVSSISFGSSLLISPCNLSVL